MAWVVALVIAYALGTLPTAVLAARLASGGDVDIRTAGTGNPGAANTLNVLGARWGAFVLFGDVAKAVLACAVGRRLAGGAGADFAGSAAVIGHCFPVWTRFRGGKGVACSAGQCLATFPVFFPVSLVVSALSGRARFRNRAYAITALSCALWVAGAVVWVAGAYPTAWGPRPTAALVLAAALSSAVIIFKFAAGERAPASLAA